MLADYSGNYQSYQHDPQANNAGQQQRIVILWDLLKTRLRKSEVEEMARMLGTELIDNLESLRGELENLIQINKDLKEERNERTGGDTVADSKSMMSESQHNDNLHQKATESGLKEDALIPMDSSKEKQIYQTLRPQSALGRPQSAKQKDGKKLSEKENSPTHTAMRSSFYSMSIMGDLNIETEDNKEITRFQQEQASRGAVVNQVNFKNILELSKTEQELLAEIKKFMNVQVDELQTEIESMQKLMLEQAQSLATAEQEQSDQDEEETVTQKDLKQYNEKLKEEFLNSGNRIKIATLPDTSASSQTKKMNITGKSFTSYLNKYQPLPVVSGASFKPTIGLGGLKTPLKLKSQTSMNESQQSVPQQRASIGKVNLPSVGPLKAQISARGSILSARGSEKGPDSARGGQLSARGAAFAQNAVAVYKEIREQNPTLEATPVKKKPDEPQGAKESGVKRSNSVVKKIKIKRKESRDRLATGRSVVKSSQMTGSPKEEKHVSPGGTVTVIPVNRITMNKPDLSQWQESGATVLGGSGVTKKIKLSRKNTAPTTSQFVVEEPRIINTVPTPEPAQSENLYGLDISILKSLNMDHLLEEKKAQQEQNTSKENWYLQNKDMEELRKEHSMQPTTKGGANKLRMMCSFYKNGEGEQREEDSN